MIVEGFDNAWHVLRGWAREGYEFFSLEGSGRVPQPRPLRREEIPTEGVAGLDYFSIPSLAPSIAGDNPDAERALTPAEILLAAAIAEGWEPD
ncbi:MAG: hypothetical protein QOE33_731 [Acidobacteriota bacterium]|nr:hypothetical protein [Acidobacteriota bacterium]